MAVKFMQKLRVFVDRYPLAGPLFWVLSVQYYLVQILVALDWSKPYSITGNTISDLGNTACAAYGDRLVCSPLHNFMDASFIVLGLTMIIGSMLSYQRFRGRLSTPIGFTFLVVAGFGTILVGLFPENTISAFHIAGATLPFIFGNLALVIFGIVLPLPKVLCILTFLGGLIALIALGLFVTSHYLGLGAGGMERVAAYPQSIWMILVGLYIAKNYKQK